MDRQLVYASSIPLDTDILSTNKNAMVGLGFLAQDVLGAGTQASGLACTPTGPATLQVQVAPGRVYSLQNIDNSAYGSLASDTTHQVLKQGISLNTVLLSCAAPATTGFSTNYLIEAAYTDSDDQNIVLNYYNSANSSQPFSGPNNTGASQPTVRQGLITLTAKAGIPAATGTQTTPAADSGNVGLWVVTVAHGATTIVSGNISMAPGAPFIPATLNSMLSYAALMAANNTWTGANYFGGAVQAFGNIPGTSSGLGLNIGAVDTPVSYTYTGFNVGFNGTNWITGTDGSSNGAVLLRSRFNPATLTCTPIPTTGGASQVIADGSLPATGWSVSSGGNFEIFAPTSGLALKVDGTTQVQSGLGVFGTTPPGSQPTGYGTPTGGSHQASFAAGSITLANLAAAVAQLIVDLKPTGLIAA